MNRGEALKLDFDKLGGLIAVVTQDASSKEVLMVGFMNAEAWQKSVETGFAHYYSRSRECLWKKGETSGHFQRIREIRIDCDQDSVLLLIEQVGGVCCHTGNRSCFYRGYSEGVLYPLDGNSL